MNMYNVYRKVLFFEFSNYLFIYGIFDVFYPNFFFLFLYIWRVSINRKGLSICLFYLKKSLFNVRKHQWLTYLWNPKLNRSTMPRFIDDTSYKLPWVITQTFKRDSFLRIKSTFPVNDFLMINQNMIVIW